MLPAGPAAQRGESRWRLVARTAFPFLVVALAWEATARLGVFPRKLFPPLEDVAAALLRLTADGVLPHHVLNTLVRLLAGFAPAAAASAKPASSRTSVLSTWGGKTPSAGGRGKAAGAASSRGNSLRGESAERAGAPPSRA